MQNFHDPWVWRRAHKATLAMCRNSRQLPQDEGFSITMQMRRAAVNIPTRLAEAIVGLLRRM